MTGIPASGQGKRLSPLFAQRRRAIWIVFKQGGTSNQSAHKTMHSEMEQLVDWILSHNLFGRVPAVLLAPVAALLGYGAWLGAMR